MNSNKYVNEKLKLQTLTPIFIGNDQGSDLSYITDYVVNGDRIHIINQKKFEQLLSEDMEILDEFVSSVKGNSRDFDLELFIKQKLNSSVDELTKEVLAVDGYIERNSVKTFINSKGKPFVPGSTIKGAIRTAIIYNYLIESEDGEKIVQKLLNPQLSIDELKAKRRLSFKEQRVLENLEQLVKNMRNTKFNRNNKFAYDFIYNELYLFKKEITGHDFRHIQISDSNLLELKQTKIIKLQREYLTRADSKTFQWSQVVKRNTELEFNFKIEKDFKDDFLKPINEKNYSEIFGMVNKFSLDVIEFELERFNEYIENGKADKDKIREKLNGTIEFYTDLKEKIKFVGNMCAVVRIGGGKTYFDNSIGLALYKADKEKFKQFRKLLGFWKHRSGSGNFVEEDSPITRTFYLGKSLNEYLPIGWTVIYFDKDKSDIEKLFEFNVKEKNENLQRETENSNSEELDLSKLANLGRIVKEKKN